MTRSSGNAETRKFETRNLETRNAETRNDGLYYESSENIDYANNIYHCQNMNYHLQSHSETQKNWVNDAGDFYTNSTMSSPAIGNENYWNYEYY